MGDFKGVDPRGLEVILEESMWVGHLDPHQDELRGKWRTVMETLRLPDRIVDNPQSPYAPTRIAIERYVRFDKALDKHVIVPVREVQAGTQFRGFVTSGPGRAAVTAYTDIVIPVARLIWLKP